ncbi:hypothetical protein SUGI_1013240 [Cryptomeria japonica]|uniref:BTB/POZ domain-containing protein At3g05675-like n=1 Tax=Cryptomeria japonica TaxID=3369 RepID=UPI002414A427|nr:BTB/POZ domain-containing protein At3g05675-like [Cryptomeria japonica]GLJ47983.1 hypothetical protein SUGI_1013240 [Cryptomeria japonica]
MEEPQLRFGALSSADVKLWLTGQNDRNYEGNPVFLHSVILKRSQFFVVKMSERWSSDKPTDIRVTTSHDFDFFLKCIQLMYDEPVYFSNIEECLAILLVASELLADDCINKCMQYLEAVRWSVEQESQIRDVLSSLGLKLLPDLTARLDKKDDNHIIFLEKIIDEMVSLIKDQQGRNLETAEKYIADILKGNTCREDVEVCGRVLLKEFKSSIASYNFRTIRLLIHFITRCVGEILKAAFVALCEDPKIMRYAMATSIDSGFNENIFYTVISFMQAIGDGKTTISRASRISLLTTWLPIMAEMCRKRVPYALYNSNLINPNLANLAKLDKAVLNVVESLPLVDRRSICVEWIRVYKKYDIDIAKPFTLFKDLQDAHHKSTPK